jgi:transcriptional regulator with XRE-family HTH domain
METGIKLKEARTAAGLSQAALAKEAGVVTASDISKAERGIKELTPEQLEALAKALGVAPESLMEAEPADVPPELSISDQELLALYRSADAEKQKVVVSALKGAQANPDLASMLADILKNNEPGALLNAVKTIILGANVGELLGLVKNFMGSISGSGKADAAKSGSTETSGAERSGSQNGSEISVPLLAFTYFYSATIYILLLSFYFWNWNKDIKPEK